MSKMHLPRTQLELSLGTKRVAPVATFADAPLDPSPTCGGAESFLLILYSVLLLVYCFCAASMHFLMRPKGGLRYKL